MGIAAAAAKKLSDFMPITIDHNTLSDLFFNNCNEAWEDAVILNSDDEKVDAALKEDAKKFCDMLGIDHAFAEPLVEDFKSRL